jgi:hypothetical protein
MKGKKGILGVSIVIFVTLAITMIVSKITAGPELIETSTHKFKKTTISWNSSFHDYSYVLGSKIEIPVTWTVDKGAATFHSLLLDEFTPKSKEDPVTGELYSVMMQNDSDDRNGVANVGFSFTNLCLDKKLNVETGVAHLILYLNVDKDGDDIPETLVGLGVNVYIERAGHDNILPVANAGPDQTVSEGDTVSLNGSGSSDADGNPLSYQWSLTPVPSGSTAVLSDSTEVNPTFVADLDGTYTYIAQLIVNDGTSDSSPDTVIISTENSRPVAYAGPDQTVLIDDTVTLAPCRLCRARSDSSHR